MCNNNVLHFIFWAENVNLVYFNVYVVTVAINSVTDVNILHSRTVNSPQTLAHNVTL